MFGKIAAVLDLLPRVIAVVQLVEELLDPDTPGAEKKEVALQALRDAGLPDKLVNLAGNLIDLVVSVMNAFGLFGHSKSDEPTNPSVPEAKLSTSAARVRRERQEINATEDAFQKFVEKTSRNE